MSTSTEMATPSGPGSVSGAPNLPAGFADTFTSRYIDTGDVRLHAVIGGDGPPLLLVHGWPETWYAWRLVMPALARDFQVIAVDQRGIGLSDKPEDGLRHRHARRRPGRADGRARPRAVRRGRPRHRIRDRLRAGRGLPGPRRARRARRDPRTSGVGRAHRRCSFPVRSTTGSGTSRSTGSRSCPSNSSRAARTSTSATSSPSRAAKLPEESIAYYVEPALRPGRPARQPRLLPRLRRHPRPERASGQARRLPDARAGDRRRGELRRSRRRTRCKPSPTTCRAWSSPAPATGSPSRHPRSCWRR